MALIETYFSPDKPDTKDNLFDASSFLGFIRRSHPLWDYDHKDLSATGWVYRGHWDHRWKLVPTAARDLVPVLETEQPNKLITLIERALEQINSSSEWESVPEILKKQFAYVEAYGASMRRFMVLGNRLGMIDEVAPRTDFLLDPITTKPTDLFDNLTTTYPFNEVSHKLLDGEPPSDMVMPPGFVLGHWVPGCMNPITALAQHHRIPTFLLDWTEQPWVAAYFATTAPEEHKDKHDICVWGLNAKVLDSGLNSVAMVNGFGTINPFRPPKSGNSYLSSQHGLLTYIKGQSNIWEGDTIYPSLDDIVRSYTPEAIATEGFYASVPEQRENHLRAIAEYFPNDQCLLRKVVLSKEHVPELRKLLLNEGITHVHLMPTLDNLASTALSHTLDCVNVSRANKKIQLTVGSAVRFQRSFLSRRAVLCQSSSNICQRHLI